MSAGQKPEPNELRLRVENDADHGLKLIWNYNAGYLTKGYPVSLAAVKDYAKKVREGFGDLITVVRNGDYSRAGAELKALAAAGRDLYEGMFDSPAQDSDENERIRKKVEAVSGKPLRVELDLRHLVQIPWGLMYDGDPDALPVDPAVADVATYRDFWCVKYSLTTVYKDSSLVPDEGFPINADQFTLLPIFNRDVLKKVRDELLDDERAWLDKVFVQPRFDKNGFLQTREELENRHALLFFLCHANGEELVLSTEHTILRHDFVKIKPRRAHHGRACLLFLNGCQTAVGMENGGFLDTVCREGFFGFIGTEAPVPRLFAARFGLDFNREFLTSEQPLYRVMDVLRRRHWPLSLLYSVYALPSLRVRPRAIPEAPQMPARNACGAFVGAEEEDL